MQLIYVMVQLTLCKKRNLFCGVTRTKADRSSSVLLSRFVPLLVRDGFQGFPTLRDRIEYPLSSFVPQNERNTRYELEVRVERSKAVFSL